MTCVRFDRTHPVRNVDFALVGDELQHAGVTDAILFGIGQLEQHWVVDVEASQLVQRRRWHYNWNIPKKPNTMISHHSQCSLMSE